MNPDTSGIYIGDSYAAQDGHDVVPIHPRNIDSARAWLTEALERAMDHAALGRIDAQALLEAAERGQALVLFVVHRASMQVKGVAAAEIFTSVSGDKVAHVTALAGADMQSWLAEFLAVGEQLAKEQGAAHITLLGRPGWQDKLAPHGYQRVAVMLSKQLEVPTV